MDTNLVYFGPNDCSDNWFRIRYFQGNSNLRYWTFVSALGLLNQRINNPVIIETGCQREKNDFGAGMSSSIFAEYISCYGGKLLIVDNNLNHLKACKSCLKEWPDIDYTLFCSDSVEWLKNYSDSCNLVYLDSYDFPLVEMLDAYGGKTDYNKAITTIMAMPPEKVLSEFGDKILPCQEHCLNEIKAIESSLADNAIVLIDDNDMPAEGKARLAKAYLHEQGWFCLADGQQTMWMRSL